MEVYLVIEKGNSKESVENIYGGTVLSIWTTHLLADKEVSSLDTDEYTKGGEYVVRAMELRS